MTAMPLTSTAATLPSVNYFHAARRHMSDADTLRTSGRNANAGQLYGFVAECGLKALLIVCGVVPDANGEIPVRHKFRQHVPVLPDRIIAEGHLIPDGMRAARYLTSLSFIGNFNSWSTDHRYWAESAIPLNKLPNWKEAAEEILRALDRAKEAGEVT